MRPNTTAKLGDTKSSARRYLRSLSPKEKVDRLIDLQEQYYSMLAAREKNGGKAIPEAWRKWHAARHG